MKKYLIEIIILIVVIGISLMPSSNIDSGINYEVITELATIQDLNISKSTSRKYEIIEKNEEYYIIIHYGEEPTYYSNLQVENVTVNKKSITIEVKLPKNEGMGDAFSYPIAVIRVDQKPENINIKYK